MFAQSYILRISKAKNIFFLSSKKETLLVQNFNLTSPIENTYHFPYMIQPFPLPPRNLKVFAWPL